MALALFPCLNSCLLQDLINVETGASFSRASRRRGSYRIMGFFWAHPTDLVFVTEKTVELYSVLLESRSCKQRKYYNVDVEWFVYSVWGKTRSRSLFLSGLTRVHTPLRRRFLIPSLRRSSMRALQQCIARNTCTSGPTCAATQPKPAPFASYTLVLQL